MQFQIRWKNASPYCWEASTNSGQTWVNLKSDNDEDSSEAIDEASREFGIRTGEWELMDE